MSLRLGAGCGGGIASWIVEGVTPGSVDGLPTDAPRASPPDHAVAHPNGALSVDHVVATTPDFERTSAKLQAAGHVLRRVREAERGARQGFFALGEAHLELVGPIEPDGDGPAAFWGITFVVCNLDGAAVVLGDRLGAPRDAVQPGRRIATVRRQAGLKTAVALISPRPPRTTGK